MTARSRGQWILLTLLVISVTINYIDRGNLSIAASRLSSELQLDPEKIGLLLSSFFWTYAAMQIVAGWLIDRYGFRKVLTIVFGVATISIAMIGQPSLPLSMLFLASIT